MAADISTLNSEYKMLSEAGYGDSAIKYYLEKPYMGSIDNADHISENVGSCGDTMKVYLKIEDNIIQDTRYEIVGCAGAISSAMAMVDLVKGQSVEDALKINDGDVFKSLENVPEKKHHCIQLAVKTMHKGLKEYKGGTAIMDTPVSIDCQKSCTQECCKKSE
ncbi:MAG: iron-sulfur cluster assembly scaffold protein [Desulfobacteraceae bacterium]|mgnify:CR=1 FL=1|nr:MAG: iron-sulfur cluster assembly scaffold protein [Desulfobacteraceae bacterium]